jgi:DNA polymerase-3 subunit epsilon
VRDTDATAILFSRLLEWDVDKVMDGMIKKTSQDLAPNLPREDFDQLPDKPGVYYFYDEHKVIYIGKAVSIKNA